MAKVPVLNESLEKTKEESTEVVKEKTADVIESTEALKGKAKEAYDQVKDNIKDKTQTAKQSASDYLFEPLKRFFNPPHSEYNDETEWLYHALLNTAPPKHFFRTFNDEYILFVDCPGIPASSLDVSITNGRLVKIQGSHEACIEEKKTGIREGRLCVERHIKQQYRYPEDVNPDAVDCAIRDGVLAIRFPRIQPVGRNVPIRQVKTGF